MKTPILVFLCLFWSVFYSYSFPQSFGGCGHCADNDVSCWTICLSPPATSSVPCGKIQACINLLAADPSHVACKDVPKTCGASPPKPSPPNPRPPIHRPNECKCLSKELDGAGLPTGHCLTRDPANNKYYCYVEKNNGCSDSKPSRRLPNLIYSYQACFNQRNDGFAAPEERCRDDDEQCRIFQA